MNTSPLPPPVVLLGVPFHRVTMDQTLDWMGWQIHRGQPGYMATANVDFAAQASKDAELQRLLLEADLVVCDGTPLVWASRWMNAPLPERVAGSDMVPAMCQRAEREGWKLYFLGASDDVLALAKARLLEKHPALRIVGMEAPPRAHLLDFDHDAITARIREAKPDILLVAFGCPKQEKWIWMHYRNLGVPVSVGIGATFDFIAGKFSRAPKILGKLGLEWIYRMIQEPKRLAFRYMVDLWFFSRAAARQKLALPPDGGGPSGASVAAAHASKATSLAWSGSIDAAAVPNMILPTIREQNPDVVLDLSAVTFMDSTGLGLLAKLYKTCAQYNGILVLLQPPGPVARLLTATNLDKLIPSATTAVEANQIVANRGGGIDRPGIGHTHTPEAMHLTLHGDIRASNAEEVFHHVAEAWLTNPDGKELVLDFRDVGFIDSSGVGSLLKIYKIVRSTPRASLRLENTNAVVRNVLHLSRLDHVFGLDT